MSLVVVEAVTADIDGNIQPGNIKKGVTILGVVGTMTGSGDIFSIQIVGEEGTLESAEVSGLSTNEQSYVIYIDVDDNNKTRYISCLLRTKAGDYLTYSGADGDEYFTVTINTKTNEYKVTKLTVTNTVSSSSTDNDIPTAKSVYTYVTDTVKTAVDTINARYFIKTFTKSDFAELTETQYVLTIKKDEHKLTNPFVQKMTLGSDGASSCIYEDKVLSSGTVKIYVAASIIKGVLEYSGKIYLQGE